MNSDNQNICRLFFIDRHLCSSRNREDDENTKKLREKEDQFNKSAKSLVESLIIHGVPLASLKSVKDVEREKNKVTKAKRKLKVQVEFN